jgi:hypothetical protein
MKKEVKKNLLAIILILILILSFAFNLFQFISAQEITETTGTMGVREDSEQNAAEEEAISPIEAISKLGSNIKANTKKETEKINKYFWENITAPLLGFKTFSGEDMTISKTLFLYIIGGVIMGIFFVVLLTLLGYSLGELNIIFSRHNSEGNTRFITKGKIITIFSLSIIFSLGLHYLEKGNISYFESEHFVNPLIFSVLVFVWAIIFNIIYGIISKRNNSKDEQKKLLKILRIYLLLILSYLVLSAFPVTNRIMQIITLELLIDNLLVRSFLIAVILFFAPEMWKSMKKYRLKRREYEKKIEEIADKETIKAIRNS